MSVWSPWHRCRRAVGVAWASRPVPFQRVTAGPSDFEVPARHASPLVGRHLAVFHRHPVPEMDHLPLPPLVRRTFAAFAGVSIGSLGEVACGF